MTLSLTLRITYILSPMHSILYREYTQATPGSQLRSDQKVDRGKEKRKREEREIKWKWKRVNEVKVAEKRGQRQNEKPFLFFSTKKTLAQKKERERKNEWIEEQEREREEEWMNCLLWSCVSDVFLLSSSFL